jgi:hypothetical protein
MWNRYSYVTNNPIGKLDPNGEAETDLTCVPADICSRPGAREAFRRGQTDALKWGLAIDAAFIGGMELPFLARAAFTWAFGNPNQAKQVMEAAISPPGPSAMPNPEAIGAAIGENLPKPGAGFTAQLIEQISAKSLSQEGAAVAAQAAYNVKGMSVTGTVTVGENLVLLSRGQGANQPVIIIDQAGKLFSGTATIQWDTAAKAIVTDLAKATQ